MITGKRNVVASCGCRRVTNKRFRRALFFSEWCLLLKKLKYMPIKDVYIGHKSTARLPDRWGKKGGGRESTSLSFTRQHPGTREQQEQDRGWLPGSEVDCVVFFGRKVKSQRISIRRLARGWGVGVWVMVSLPYHRKPGNTRYSEDTKETPTS